MKSTFAIGLSFVMLITALVSCSGKTDNDDAGSDSVDQTTEFINEMVFLPEGIGYDGAEVSILYGHNIENFVNLNEITYVYEEITQGDIIQEAVYKRTSLTESKLDVKITSYQMNWDVVMDEIQSSVMGATGAFEAVCGRLNSMSQAMIKGYLYNLNAIETLDLSQPWWDESTNESMTIGDKQYIATGDINYFDDYAINIIMFNKRLFDDYRIEEPYVEVRDGSWTFENFYALVNERAFDVDGNGRYDEHDIYGYVSNNASMTLFLTGFGEKFVNTDSDGVITLDKSESVINKALDFSSKMSDNLSILVEERELGYELGDIIFPEGRAFMSQSLVGVMASYRTMMEDDFGVLPFPKYTEEQSDYYGNASQHWGTAISVPGNCSDVSRIGYILDTMGYYSPDTVTEAVIEKNIYIKATRDEDTGDMLRIIFDSKVFDRTMAFNWGIYDMYCTMNQNKNPQIVSAIDSKEESINKKIADYIAAVNELS